MKEARMSIEVEEMVEPKMTAEDEAQWAAEAAVLREEMEERKRLGEKPGLLDMDEAKFYAGRSRSDLLSAIGGGELKAIRFMAKGAGRWKFTKADLDAWLRKPHSVQ
jgi:hypothetical protein